MSAGSAWPHTRKDEPDVGPPYCQQCSERAQAWVTWPCAGTRLLALAMLGRTPGAGGA